LIVGLFAEAALATVAGAQRLTWCDLADLPRPVAGYMAGVSHRRLLIIGGSYWEDEKKQWSDLVQSFDPQTNSWRNETALPEPRSDAASATVGSDVYIFGGGSASRVRKDALLLRDGKWSRLPGANLPEPRLYAVAVASHGSIYILGGISIAGNYKTATNTFWRLRLGEKGWKTLPPLPGPGRFNHAMADIQGKIYVFGGATAGPDGVQNLSDAYRFDPALDKWMHLPELRVANRSWWAVEVGERALLLAGYTNDFRREVYWYDTKSSQIQPAGDLPHALADIKFFRMGDLLIGAGGEAGPRVRGRWTMQAKLPKSKRSILPKD
jgi:N-acetylneuraminic acid mutarotase